MQIMRIESGTRSKTGYKRAILQNCSKSKTTQNWLLKANYHAGTLLVLRFSEFFVDLQKKRSSCQFGLFFFLSSMLISKKEKRASRNKLFYLFPSFLLVSKKSHHFETAARERGIGGQAKHFRGKTFLFRGAPPPFAPHPSCVPVHLKTSSTATFEVAHMPTFVDQYIGLCRKRLNGLSN